MAATERLLVQRSKRTANTCYRDSLWHSKEDWDLSLKRTKLHALLTSPASLMGKGKDSYSRGMWNFAPECYCQHLMGRECAISAVQPLKNSPNHQTVRSAKKNKREVDIFRQRNFSLKKFKNLFAHCQWCWGKAVHPKRSYFHHSFSMALGRN